MTASTIDIFTPLQVQSYHWGYIYYINTGETRELVDDVFTIGRDVSCDWVIMAPECSKQHCQISLFREKNDITLAQIVDQSTNGTLVNGTRIQKGLKVVLNHGDEIEIRKGHKFLFRLRNQETEAEKILSRDPEFKNMQSDYHLSQVLGTGTYAVVCKAVCKSTGRKFACKIVDKAKAGLLDFNVKDVPEIAIMDSVSHANIIKFHSYEQTRRFIYIFLQIAEGGELFEYLERKRQIPERECKFICFQVFTALKHLHDRGICHRDIKPENILLESQTKFAKLYLGDFGLAKLRSSFMKTLCGTLNYLAPEVLERTEYSKAVDCWAVGVMLYFLLSGVHPFDHQNEETLRKIIRVGVFCFPDNPFSRISVEAKDMISRLLTKDPESRINVDEAFLHPWIANDFAFLHDLYLKTIN